MNKRIKEITITGLGLALVFCGTYFFIFPNHLGGYMNLGDGFILLFATILNPLGSFIVGGIGSAIADIASGYGLYAPFTFVIKGMEGCCVACLLKKFDKQYLLAYLMGCLIMTGGYFLVDWFLQQSFVVAISGLPTNILQSIFGLIIACILRALVAKKAKAYLQ